MSLRKVFLISVAACLSTEGIAWILWGNSFSPEKMGLKPIASYARVSSLNDCLKVGDNSQDDIVIPEYTGTDAVCLSLQGEGWQLAPGADGGVVGDAHQGEALGAALRVPGRYSLAIHDRQMAFELTRAVRISVRNGDSEPIIVLFNARPGATLSLPELQGGVLSANPDIAIAMGSKVKRLKVNREVKIGNLRIERLPSDPSWWNYHKVSETPFFVTVLEDGVPPLEQILWPGASLDFPDEQVVIQASRQHTPKVRLSLTDPESATVVSPTQQDFGIAKGSIDQPLTIEGRTYRLLHIASAGTGGAQPSSLAVLIRVPAAFNRWRFLGGGPIQSWNDAALFNPYTFLPIAGCDSGNAVSKAQFAPVSTGETAMRPPASMPAGEAAHGADFVGPDTAPAWLSDQERALRLSVCEVGASFRVAAFDRAGNQVSVPLDGVIKNGETEWRFPARATAQTLSAGDVFLYDGRAYQLIGNATPASLVLFPALTPVAFLAAALPLLWLLSRRSAELGSKLAGYAGTRPDKFLRRLVACAPIAGAACILGLMTIGAYFQLSLAASSALAANVRYFNVFLTSGMEAVAMTTLLLRWMDGQRTWIALASGIRDALLAFALGTTVLEWLEPLLQRRAMAAHEAWPLVPNRPDGGWWVPLLFLAGAAFVARIASRLAGRRSRQPKWAGAPRALQPNLGEASQQASGWVDRVWVAVAAAYEEGLDDLSRRRPAQSGDDSAETGPGPATEEAGTADDRVGKLWRALLRCPLGFLFFVCFFFLSWVLFPLLRVRKVLLSLQRDPGADELPTASVPAGCEAGGAATANGAQAPAAKRSWLKLTGKILLSALLFALLGLAPLLLLFVLARAWDFVANLGKEIVPPLLLLWAVSALGGLGVFAQFGPSQSVPDSRRGLIHTLTMGFCVIAFSAGMLCLPLLFSWIYFTPAILCAFVVSVLSSLAIWWIPGGEVPGILLYNVLPFYGALLAAAVVFKDFGAMLVWMWTLSWIGAWALMLNVLLAGTKRPWQTGLGTLVCSLNLIAVPLTLLGVVNSLRGTFLFPDAAGGILTNVIHFPDVSGAIGSTRVLSRFRLAAAPFYYNAGEWLARVQLMALGPKEAKNVHWIPNLNSDVALNGLHYLLPKEHTLAMCLFAVLFFTLALCFGEAFRYAVQSTGQRPYFIRAALVIATAFFGLGMFLFVHLGASLFDILPLTGVPCPWISNALIVHIVMTALVLCTLYFAADCTFHRGSEKGGSDGNGYR